MDVQKKGGSVLLWTVGVVVLALIAYGVYSYSTSGKTDTNTISNSTDNNNNSVTPPTTTGGTSNSNSGSSNSGSGTSGGGTPTPTPTPTPTSAYKDGTYTAEGDYVSPGGAEAITVTVTLKNDVITDATVVSLVSERSESVEYQGKFISGFKALVIGKKITDVHLSRVSGSSLTSTGWNSAIAKIETQAQA